MNTKDLLIEIRKSPFVRAFLFPVGMLKKRIERNAYFRTDEPEKIRKYKGIHRNERCFILGNGPSLSPEDLGLLMGEITFASNRIYALYDKTNWRPTYYVSIDKDFLRREIKNVIKVKNSQKFIDVWAMRFADLQDCIFICGVPFFNICVYGHKRSCIKEDVSEYFSDGGSVTFTMIQLAIYMGFKEIYLLGIDFSMPYYKDKFGIPHKTDETKEHFEGGSVFQKTYFNRDSNLYAFQQAKKYCDEHNIVIKNVTRGGKLEVFERDTLENVLEKG